MKAFFRDNALFLSHCVVFLTIVGCLLCFIPKGELHIALNGFHSSAGDFFFRYYTVVGEWVAYVIVGLLLFYKTGAASFVLASNLLSGLVTQIIKRIVRAPRPSVFFDLANNPDILPTVEGVRLHASNSFPSGHTATFVAVFFALSILLMRKDIRISPTIRMLGQYACFVCAILGAYSRIYLSQHFAADIFAGMLIALCVTSAIYPLFTLWEKRAPTSFTWHISKLYKK